LLKKYYPDKAVHMRKTQNAALDKLLTNCEEKKTLPLPEQFRGKNAVSISAADFKKVACEQKLTDDPEAAGGKGMAVEKWFHFDGKRDPASLFAGLPSFGIQDRTRKCTVAKRTLKRDEIPADEKYHLYLIGRSQVKGNVIVFAHGTWYIQVPTKSAFSAKKPDQFYDFWISLKLQGPAYVPGSKRKNAFIVDRVILVPSEKQ
ncbi:MAG: hypothetical protein IJH79_09920, partial [Lentisphaeria bacterium]|nr:hypothetical protein [Lentisphaeria bacterium]